MGGPPKPQNPRTPKSNFRGNKFESARMISEDIIESKQEARVIPIDDDEIVKVKSGPNAKPNYIRIHVYLGTLCRSEIFDKARDFEENKDSILDKFGIGSKLQPED